MTHSTTTTVSSPRVGRVISWRLNIEQWFSSVSHSSSSSSSTGRPPYLVRTSTHALTYAFSVQRS